MDNFSVNDKIFGFMTQGISFNFDLPDKVDGLKNLVLVSATNEIAEAAPNQLGQVCIRR